MAVIENDYAAYIQTPDGEVPLRDLDAQEKIGSLSEDSAPSIVETYNGRTIQCSMSADRPFKGLNLYATCKQQTYSGKNLFNKDTTENGTVNASGQVDYNETVKTSDFIKVKPSTQYKSTFASAHIKFYTSEKEPVQTENVDITTGTTNFTTGESTEYIRYSFNSTAQSPETLIVVEGTNELTPYEPYTGGIPSPNGDYPQEIQTISDFVVEVKNSMGEVATPQTLNVVIPEQGFCAIPMPRNGNYTDTDGQQWICDEFDFTNKKFIKRAGRIEFDGSSDEKWSTGNLTENRMGFRIGLENATIKSGAKCLCNIATHGTADASGQCFTTNGIFYIFVDPSINNLELWRQYLSTHKLDVIYQLAAPIEYNLTSEQVEQFKKLRSYYGTTYIDNNAVPACNMQAKLVLDTKLYIDSKFTTLAGQILEMGV